MDFKKKEIGHLLAKYLVLLFCLFPVTASRNINCNGKAFYCPNATHFSICVDFGFGISITIDDFAFLCPQGTECHIENQHECEIMQATTPKEINELTTESLHVMDKLTTNSLPTTESNTFSTNNNIVVSNKKSLLDENVVPASTTETTIQNTGTQGYFTEDLVTPEDVTMNTVAVVTMAHTTEPITKKRTFAERDLSNVSHNKSIDVNETLNVIQETYTKMTTLSNINSDTLSQYTTTKTSEITQGIEPQTEAKQNNNNQNFIADIVSHISTQATSRTHAISLKKETLLETTTVDTFDEEKEENIAYTAGVTTEIVTELLDVNVGKGFLLPSEVNSGDVSTKTSKVDGVTEIINVGDNNQVMKENDSILHSLETVTDIASDILPGTVNESTLKQGVDVVKTTSNVTKPQLLNVKQETQTTTKNLKEHEIKTNHYTDSSIQSTDLVPVTRTNITIEKGVTLSVITEVNPPVTATEIPSLDINDLNVSSSVIISSHMNAENTDNLINKTTEIPYLDVNDLSVSSSVTITTDRITKNINTLINKATDISSSDVNDLYVSSNVNMSLDRNTENTDNLIGKEVSNLQEDKVTSNEKMYPNLKMESISSTTSHYAVADAQYLSNNNINDLYIVETTKDNQEDKIENESTIEPTPTPKLNIAKKTNPRNETITEKTNLHLKPESSTSTILSNLNAKTQYLGNNEENYILEMTGIYPMKLQEDKQDNISPIEITPTLTLTEKQFLSSKDQNISEPIIYLDGVTEKQLININKHNISSNTTSVYTTVDERPNVQEQQGLTPTRLNTEKYNIMAKTNSDLNKNVDTNDINKMTITTNAYLRNIDSKHFSSANSVTEVFSNIETPTLVTKLIAPSTKDIQVTTTESYKLIVNNKNYVNISTVFLTNSGIQERSKYPESNILLTYNTTTENHNQADHLKHTPEEITSTNLQSTISRDYQRDIISSSSIKFTQNTVKPISINEVSNTHLQESSKANFVTEKSYVDGDNHWKVFISMPNYTIKSNMNNPEKSSLYRKNSGSNINSTISTTTKRYINIISESETQHPKNHNLIVNSSTERATTFEKHNIVNNGHVQKTNVDKQDKTVTRNSTGSKPKVVTVAKNYTTSPADVESGQTQYLKIESTSYAYVTKVNPTIEMNNFSVNTISSEKGTIQEPVRTDSSTVPIAIRTNVNYPNHKENNKIVTNSQHIIVTTSNLNDGHTQSQLSTHNEIKGETGYDSRKQNQHNLLANNNQAAVGSFNCSKHKRGKFGDSTDCRKFYICIGLPIPMVYYCPKNTVFSEKNRQCTKHISHCVRNNEFRCTQEGRFHDYLRRNVYYLCVKKQQNHFNRYKLQCRKNFYLDKDDVKCIQEKKSMSLNSESSNVEDKSKVKSSLDSKVKSKSNNSKERKDFKCEEEGKFPHPKSCKKYYKCEKKKSVLRRKKKRCDSHEIFNKETSKCVSSDSYECED